MRIVIVKSTLESALQQLAEDPSNCWWLNEEVAILGDDVTDLEEALVHDGDLPLEDYVFIDTAAGTMQTAVKQRPKFVTFKFKGV